MWKMLPDVPVLSGVPGRRRIIGIMKKRNQREETIMNRNSNGMSTGMALLCTLGILLSIGWIINLGTPKCIMSGCDNDAIAVMTRH